jgi:hypothetical protein
MLQLTAIVHPAAQATSQAATSSDGATNIAVLLAAGLLVVVLVRLVRVFGTVVSTLATAASALGGVLLIAVAMLVAFMITVGMHGITR